MARRDTRAVPHHTRTSAARKNVANQIVENNTNCIANPPKRHKTVPQSYPITCSATMEVFQTSRAFNNALIATMGSLKAPDLKLESPIPCHAAHSRDIGDTWYFKLKAGRFRRKKTDAARGVRLNVILSGRLGLLASTHPTKGTQTRHEQR